MSPFAYEISVSTMVIWAHAFCYDQGTGRVRSEFPNYPLYDTTEQANNRWPLVGRIKQ